MKDLNNVLVFVRVAEARNFTEASEGLGLSGSAISKIVTKFEAELGVRLFNRSTRAVSLTSDGVRFFRRCKEILAIIEDAEDAVRKNSGSLPGPIRFTTPVSYGRRIIVPALPAFAAQYPNITIEAELSDRSVDLSYEPIDIAIIRGPIPDEWAVARKLCTLNFVACASPAYIARFGEPAKPEDLVKHHCLAYMDPQLGRHREWLFCREERIFKIAAAGRVNINSADSLLELACAGLGIVMLSTMYTADAIRSGKLKMLLTDYVAPGIDVSAIYLPNRSLSPRIRVFVDFLLKLAPSVPNWNQLI
jgi:LysR family transcriptional regulator, regulator for bpeEF and oprC